jgi:hypothetical protein
MLIRQGDVLLVPVATVPGDAKKVARDHGRVVLAYGESTGHAHVIVEEDVTLVTTEEAEQLRTWLLVETAEPVHLTHDEHDTLTVAPGTYEVRVQREYVAADIARNVSD